MKKPLKVKIGHVACQNCQTKVPVRKNDATGALSFPCYECGLPGYAKNDGNDYYRDVLNRMTPLDTPQDVPTPASTSQHVPAKPAPAPARTSQDVPNDPGKPSRATVFG